MNPTTNSPQVLLRAALLSYPFIQVAAASDWEVTLGLLDPSAQEAKTLGGSATYFLAPLDSAAPEPLSELSFMQRPSALTVFANRSDETLHSRQTITTAIFTQLTIRSEQRIDTTAYGIGFKW